MLDRPEFQSRRPGFRLCDSGDRRPFQLAPDSFSPVDRDLGFATFDFPRSPISSRFQSRRPGFRLCDVVAASIQPCGLRFSPVDRDLGFATERTPSPLKRATSFSPVDRDLGFATQPYEYLTLPI